MIFSFSSSGIWWYELSSSVYSIYARGRSASLCYKDASEVTHAFYSGVTLLIFVAIVYVLLCVLILNLLLYSNLAGVFNAFIFTLLTWLSYLVVAWFQRDLIEPAGWEMDFSISQEKALILGKWFFFSLIWNGN